MTSPAWRRDISFETSLRIYKTLWPEDLTWHTIVALKYSKERGVSRRGEILRHRLHGRGFQSKRFHDLEIESKTTRFQRVYTQPIQPLNPVVFKYVKAILFSGVCASSIGSGFDQTRVRRLSSPRPNPESSFGFSLRYSAGAYRRKSQNFKTFLPVISVWLSVYSKIVYTKAAKAKINHRSKLWLCSKAMHSVRNLPYLLRGPANFAPVRFSNCLISVHPYCARKFTCHVIHQARANSAKGVQSHLNFSRI